jgi:hypothetical protein
MTSRQIDVPLKWRTSSYTNDTNCVEAAALPGGGVAVRDSKDRGGLVLEFTRQQWAGLCGRIKDGTL